MKVKTEKTEQGEIKLTITVPPKRVEKVTEEVLEEAAKEMEIEGFRKGKAPLSEVKKRMEPGEVNGEVVNQIIPEAYTKAIREEELKPIADPQIEIKQFTPGNEFIFEVLTCETPEVDLGNWREAISNLEETSKIETAATITEAETKAEQENTEKEISLEQIINALNQEAEVSLPDILVESEVGRMLSQLHDQLDSLGLSVEEYLKNQDVAREELRGQYTNQAKKKLKTEFVLAQLAEEMDIEVTDQEIEQAIEQAPEDADKEELDNPRTKAYLRAIIRKNKTVQQLNQIANPSAKTSQQEPTIETP